MARKKSKSRKSASKSKTETVEKAGFNKSGTLALFLLVVVVAVMVYAALGLKKPSVEVGTEVQLPAYAYISARSEQSYRTAIDPIITDGDVFSKIPCYCGCIGVGHTSLKDCFLDTHGSMCDVCQYEALETYDMVKKGVPLSQIRADIDSRYGGGRFGPGTDTPPVA